MLFNLLLHDIQISDRKWSGATRGYYSLQHTRSGPFAPLIPVSWWLIHLRWSAVIFFGVPTVEIWSETSPNYLLVRINSVVVKNSFSNLFILPPCPCLENFNRIIMNITRQDMVMPLLMRLPGVGNTKSIVNLSYWKLELRILTT